MNLLDLVIFLPAIGFLLVLLLPKENVETIKRATSIFIPLPQGWRRLFIVGKSQRRLASG